MTGNKLSSDIWQAPGNNKVQRYTKYHIEKEGDKERYLCITNVTLSRLDLGSISSSKKESPPIISDLLSFRKIERVQYTGSELLYTYKFGSSMVNINSKQLTLFWLYNKSLNRTKYYLFNSPFGYKFPEYKEISLNYKEPRNFRFTNSKESETVGEFNLEFLKDPTFFDFDGLDMPSVIIPGQTKYTDVYDIKNDGYLYSSVNDDIFEQVGDLTIEVKDNTLGYGSPFKSLEYISSTKLIPPTYKQSDTLVGTVVASRLQKVKFNSVTKKMYLTYVTVKRTNISEITYHYLLLSDKAYDDSKPIEDDVNSQKDANMFGIQFKWVYMNNGKGRYTGGSEDNGAIPIKGKILAYGEVKLYLFCPLDVRIVENSNGNGNDNDTDTEITYVFNRLIFYGAEYIPIKGGSSIPSFNINQDGKKMYFKTNKNKEIVNVGLTGDNGKTTQTKDILDFGSRNTSRDIRDIKDFLTTVWIVSSRSYNVGNGLGIDQTNYVDQYLNLIQVYNPDTDQVFIYTIIQKGKLNYLNTKYIVNYRGRDVEMEKFIRFG